MAKGSLKRVAGRKHKKKENREINDFRHHERVHGKLLMSNRHREKKERRVETITRCLKRHCQRCDNIRMPHNCAVAAASKL
mmetsp:Transcript_45304/g.54955  ORF Transcript_45304/g.54955 Transcript_45304/m.54955 type:complete len:81 (-) Transcript_45304:33-275(-)